MNLPKQTTVYLNRPVDTRIVEIIQTYLAHTQTVLDLGSGSGIYGETLSQQNNSVTGYDYDPALCKAALRTQQYSAVICDDAANLLSHITSVDVIFCSEFLEHISNTNLRTVLDDMESICKDTIIITMPNPLSPHFKDDPTHITTYTIYSMRTLLNRSKVFQYSMHPIGFSEYNKRNIFFRLLNPIAKRIPICSPTILYVGKRK